MVAVIEVQVENNRKSEVDGGAGGFGPNSE